MSDASINGVSDSLIYTGFWTNWTYGQIRGGTLTLTKRNGALVTAAITLFVTMVGRSFWRLFCFAAHTKLSNSTARDGLYHQRQAILRNADEGLAGMKLFVKLGWAWRSKLPRFWLRIGPFIGLTSFLTIGFYVASLFSSRISSVTNEVLISSPRCGIFQGTPNATSEVTEVLPYRSKLFAASASYADQCYGNSASSQECSVFVQKQIPQAVSQNTSCPFPGMEKICMREKTNLRIDTGNLSSHEHFGINAAAKDRFTYRQVLECAPLRTQGFSKIKDHFGNGNLTVDLRYGRLRDTNKLTGDTTFYWPIAVPAQLQEFVMRSMMYDPDDDGSVFTPIPELRGNATTSLFFLTGNNVKFIEPVDDEFFAAHSPNDNGISNGANGANAYTFDGLVHVLGCAAQHQFCLNQTLCSPLTGWHHASRWTQPRTMGIRQTDSFNIWAVTYSALGATIDDLVGRLGASALITRNSFIDGAQGPLSRNQWQLEVQHWQATTMALLQRMVIEVATGPSDSVIDKYIVKPIKGDEGDETQCHSQKVKSASHTSFSVLGLCITFFVGITIVLLEIGAETLYRLIWRKRGLSQRLEWVTNETLQLQRMAHEELGAGTWVGGAESIPTTVKIESLARLDVSNERHPRLIYQPSKKSEGQSSASHSEQQLSPPPTTPIETVQVYHQGNMQGSPVSASPIASNPGSSHPSFPEVASASHVLTSSPLTPLSPQTPENTPISPNAAQNQNAIAAYQHSNTGHAIYNHQPTSAPVSSIQQGSHTSAITASRLGAALPPTPEEQLTRQAWL